MGWEAWFTAAVVLSMLATLATGRFGTDIVMLGALTLFLVTGIVDPSEAFRGFSNPGLLTVAFLYVVATGLQETGGMSLLTSRLLGRPRTALQAQARMILPVAGMSAFMNNTPLVAMFLPVLKELSRRARIPASQLFMPLSFAAILGGACTLIGTSTNLVVYSLIEAHRREHPEVAMPTFGMWTLSLVGVPVLLVGIAYILLFGRRLLPARSDGAGSEGAARQYMTAMLVPAGSPMVGKSVEAAGLRQLPGLFLSRIDRETETVFAVGPDEMVRAGDVLVFVGALDSVVDLQRTRGLVPVTDETGVDHYRPKMKLIEAVISHASPLVGRSVRGAAIRTRYGAAVVAVHRLGHRLEGKIGDIKLRQGDTLLLEAEPGFAKRHRHSPDFHLVSELEGTAGLRHERAWIAVAILAALVLVMSTGELPLIGDVPEVVAAMCAAGAMVLFRCCTGPQARAGMEWPVLVVIGASFGVAKAMEKTGLATFVAQQIMGAAGPIGPWALIAAVYLLTLGFTTLISNNAAAALMFPIALGVAQEAELNFLPFAVCIAMAASLEFMTPLGYQTNLMVLGPGGYRWSDFLRFGGPLTALAAIVCILLVPLLYSPLG